LLRRRKLPHLLGECKKKKGKSKPFSKIPKGKDQEMKERMVAF